MPQQRKPALKKALYHYYIYCFLSLLFSGYATADTLPPQAIPNNCESVSVDYFDNPELTRAEKLALMEKAFYASLLKFEDCSINTSQSSSNGGSNGGIASAGSAESSSSSETLQGTEPDESIEQSTASSDATEEIVSEAKANGPINSDSNGKIPEDIPSADNDDVLAAQIRAAAEAETDPETRKKLWNEYRKYKGISSE